MTNQAMLELCTIYYDETTLEHAKRVAEKAKNLYQIFDTSFSGGSDFLFQLGLAHELYEKTNITKKIWFDEDFENNLILLTKISNINYEDYILTIRSRAFNHKSIYIPAYIVKLADISDNFAQVDTLTDELKNKYVAAISCLI